MSKPKFEIDPNKAFQAIIGSKATGQTEGSGEIRTPAVQDEVFLDDEKGMFVDIQMKEKEEARTKKFLTIVKPSVHERATAKCKKMKISLNECINQFLEIWIEK